MAKNKIYRISFFITGVALSLIVNLATGEMNNLYQRYRNPILLTGCFLVILGSILSFIEETESLNITEENASKSKTSIATIIGSFIKSTFVSMLWGFVFSIVVLYVVQLFIRETILADYMLTKGYIFVMPIGVGIIIGQRFRYIFGDRLTAGIVGAILGFAITFYFPIGFSVVSVFEGNTALLPPRAVSDIEKFKLEKPASYSKLIMGFDCILKGIAGSILISGLIGGFTSIYEKNYKLKIQTKIDELNKAKIHLQNKGYSFKSSGIYDRILRYEQKLNSMEKRDDNKKVIESYKEEIQWIKKVKAKIFDDVDVHAFIFFFLKDVLWLPKPPYYVYDENGNEVKSYKSSSELLQFSLQLGVN